jgi:hypothetical protein
MNTTELAVAEELAELVGRGDRRALARAISAVEDGAASADDLVHAVRERLRANARRVAVTGPPGAGKSTLVGKMVVELLDAGRRVGVLLVDPSSPVSGGVAATTSKLVELLEGWGADAVIIETVGAGQGEIDVCRIADCTVVVCPPGLGDELQAMKAGLMELADVLVVNKADRPGADATERSLNRSGPGGRGRRPRPVLKTVATTGEGVAGLIEAVDAALDQDGRRDADAGHEPRDTTGARQDSAQTRPQPSFSQFDLTDRVVLVTGATGGLGRRFAQVLHGAGASVVLAARRADRLDELHRTLSRSVPVPCDVSDPAQRAHLVEAALAAFGRIDVLVNNAGVSGPAVDSETHPWQRWQQTLEVNLSGLFGLTQLVARHMLAEGRGSVVNIASVFGLVANSPVNDAAYAATKGAVVNLTRALGVEWANRGVRVNAIAPGWFPSEMTADMVDDEASQRYVQRFCPMQRMGREDELDGAVLFFAADASRYCTGQTLAIDGGWTAR